MKNIRLLMGVLLCEQFLSLIVVRGASIESEHYKLGVGQGECSTTISVLLTTVSGEKSTIAVTADIGSSSLVADKKFTSLYASGFSTILQKIGISTSYKSTLPAAPNQSEKTHLKQTIVQKNKKTGRAGSMQSDSSFKSTIDFLTQKFIDKQLDCWVVFLSHPDKDHINYLETVFEEVIKTRVQMKMILLAGGEWFNSNSTQNIREVMSLIKKHENNICAYFPFELGRRSHEEMKEWFKNHQIDKNNPDSFNSQKPVLYKDSQSPTIHTYEFQGNLNDLLVNKGFTAFSGMNSIDNIESFLGLNSKSTVYPEIVNHIFKKIYIWSLDYPIGNDNARSLVWSHAVDDIGWTFVYTGDAESCTFEKINTTNSNYKANWNEKNNLVILQGMHHGSKENVSERAISLFNPDAIAFSAGTGSQFGHPSIDALDGWMSSKKKILGYRDLVKQTRFWENFTTNQTSNYFFAAFKDKDSGKSGTATLEHLETNSYPFLHEYFWDVIF